MRQASAVTMVLRGVEDEAAALLGAELADATVEWLA